MFYNVCYYYVIEVVYFLMILRMLCQEPHGLGEVKDLDGGADGVVGVRKLGANLIWIS